MLILQDVLDFRPWIAIVGLYHIKNKLTLFFCGLPLPTYRLVLACSLELAWLGSVFTFVTDFLILWILHLVISRPNLFLKAVFIFSISKFYASSRACIDTAPLSQLCSRAVRRALKMKEGTYSFLPRTLPPQERTHSSSSWDCPQTSQAMFWIAYLNKLR
jgi:hypothetical protein